MKKTMILFFYCMCFSDFLSIKSHDFLTMACTIKLWHKRTTTSQMVAKFSSRWSPPGRLRRDQPAIRGEKAVKQKGQPAGSLSKYLYVAMYLYVTYVYLYILHICQSIVNQHEPRSINEFWNYLEFGFTLQKAKTGAFFTNQQLQPCGTLTVKIDFLTPSAFPVSHFFQPEIWRAPDRDHVHLLSIV